MARFDVSYNIIAIDKFSDVIAKISKQMKALKDIASVSTSAISDATISAISRSSATAIDKMRAVAAEIKLLPNLVMPKIPKTPKIPELDITQGVIPNLDRDMYKLGKVSGHKFGDGFAHWADKFAFLAFINSMNVVMPLVSIFAKPFTALMSSQAALASMSTLHLNTNALDAQASQLSKVTEFPRDAILSAQAQLASKGANQANIQKLIPRLIDIAASTKTPLSSIVDSTSQAIFAINKLSAVGSVLVQGGTQAARIQSLISQTDTRIGGTAIAQALTPLGRMKVAVDNLSLALQNLLVVATPIFEKLAIVINVASAAVLDFTNKHKELVKIIVIAVGAMLALVLGSVILGAVLAGVATLFKLGRFAIIAFKIATFGATDAIALFRSGMKLFSGTGGAFTSILSRIKSSFLLLAIKLPFIAARFLYLRSTMILSRLAMFAWQAAIIGLRAALLAVNAVVAVFNLLLDLNPIGAIILGITALIAVIVLLITHWKQVKDFVVNVCTGIKNAIHDNFMAPLVSIYHFIETKLLGVLGKLKNGMSFISHPLSAIGHVLSKPLDAIAHVITSPFIDDYTKLKVTNPNTLVSNQNVNNNTVHLYHNGVHAQTVNSVSTKSTANLGVSSMELYSAMTGVL